MKTNRGLCALALGVFACSGEGGAVRQPGATPTPAPLPVTTPPGEATPTPSVPVDPGPPSEPAVVAPSPTVTVELALGGLFPEGAQLAGLARGADGQLYVLEATAGLFRVSAEAAEQVFSFAAAGETREFTDVAAMGSQFLLTAEDDGFLLDLEQQSLTQYFCYLPSTLPEELVDVRPSTSQELEAAGIPAKQRTESVTVNPATGELFVQPRTIVLEDGSVAGAEVFVFAPTGGEPIATQSLGNPDFLAGGMVAVREENSQTFIDYLILGSGGSLFRMTQGLEPERLVGFADLTAITGLSLAQNGDVLMLDGARKQVLRVAGLPSASALLAPTTLTAL